MTLAHLRLQGYVNGCMPIKKTRIEKDTMGAIRVPAKVYWGAATARAIQNFPISGIRFTRPFIGALGELKCAAGLIAKSKAKTLALHGTALATALAPLIGYDKAAKL